METGYDYRVDKDRLEKTEREKSAAYRKTVDAYAENPSRKNSLAVDVAYQDWHKAWEALTGGWSCQDIINQEG